MTDEGLDLDTAARRLEGQSPAEILGWATTTLGSGDDGRRVAFATGFGPEGCVLIDVIARHALPIDIFTLDTGLLFPETYELWRRLEARYGLVIRGVTPAQTVDEQAIAHGPALWAREPDHCCQLRKVEPLAAALVGYRAWISAIRRDQTPERASARIVEPDPRSNLVKLNPLVAWSHDDVWAHLYTHDVPTNPLHDRGYPSIGCEPCTSQIVPGEHLRAGRWRGSAKRECGLHIAAPVMKDNR